MHAVYGNTSSFSFSSQIRKPIANPGGHSLAVTVLLDGALRKNGAHSRGSRIANNLYKSLEKVGVAMTTVSYGPRTRGVSLAQRAIRATRAVFTRRRLCNVDLTEPEIFSQIDKMSRLFEDKKVIVVVTSEENTSLALSESVHARACSGEIEVHVLSIDSKTNRSAIMHHGFQVHFSETTDFTDDVLAKLLKKHVMGCPV